MDQSTLKYYSDNAAQVAERYESVVSYLFAHFADSFSKGGKVLDIGCGSGRDLAVLHKLGFDYYGVDPVLEFVEIAQRLHPVLANRIFVFKWVLLFVTVRRCRLIRNSKKKPSLSTI